MMNFSSKNAKYGFILGTCIVSAFLILGLWWIFKSTWTPILNAAEAPHSRLEIRNHLMEWGVPFKEDLSTGNILVEESQLLSIRNRLSQIGIPEEPAPGLEIFSDAEYGMSEFTQRINYQRAIEAEIANTIRSFADVKAARVHLTIPKKSIFQDNQTPPKASVSLQPRNGQKLNNAQIQGISELVAASVDGLSAENVIVINEYGEVISHRNDESNHQGKLDQESYYEERVKNLLSDIAKPNEIKVLVNFTYNLDKIKSIREQIFPKSLTEEGFLARSSKHTSTENKENSLEKTNTSTVEEEFIFSKERSEIEHAYGNIKNISVGIVIARSLPEPVISRVTTVVSSGLGLEEARGDRISIITVSEKNEKSYEISQHQHKNLETDIIGSKSNNVSLNLLSEDIIFISIGFLLLIISIILFTLQKKPTKKLSTEEKERILSELKKWLAIESLR